MSLVHSVNECLSFFISYSPQTTTSTDCILIQSQGILRRDVLFAGFTGHVPQSRFMIGQGYPILTNQALIQFGQQQQQQGGCLTAQDASVGKLGERPRLLRQSRGLMPSYTGHIPGCQYSESPCPCRSHQVLEALTLRRPTGYRYLWGGTYGHLVPMAIEQFRKERTQQQDRA